MFNPIIFFFRFLPTGPGTPEAGAVLHRTQSFLGTEKLDIVNQIDRHPWKYRALSKKEAHFHF